MGIYHSGWGTSFGDRGIVLDEFVASFGDWGIVLDDSVASLGGWGIVLDDLVANFGDWGIVLDVFVANFDCLGHSLVYGGIVSGEDNSHPYMAAFRGGNPLYSLLYVFPEDGQDGVLRVSRFWCF